MTDVPAPIGSADWLVLAAVYAYAFALVGAVELAARRRVVSGQLGRKAIHLGVGVMPFWLVSGISDWRLALLPPASFVVLNALSHRLRLSRAMDAVAAPSLGTVYYPLALCVLIALLWHSPARYLAAVAMLPMIVGDAADALAGERWGKRTPTMQLPWAGKKSLAGSSAMWLGSALSLWAGLAWAKGMAGPAFATATPAMLAAVAAAVAVAVTCVELVSPYGTDNLTIPLVTAALLWWLGQRTGTAATLLVGFAFAALVAIAAWRVGALSASGAAGALLTGGLVFGLGGWRWAAVLLAFFLSGSALSRLPSRYKQAGADAYAAKGGRRDLGQVLANGGVPLLAVLLAAVSAGTWPLPLFLGSMATVTADTWATEIGTRSRQQPRLLTTWQRVAAGTSGGVTAAGTLASLAGALLIAAVGGSGPGLGSGTGPGSLFIATTLGGLLGSLSDSLLGATVQAVRWCPACETLTERLAHTCGTATVWRRGIRWLNNDGVNCIAAAVGGLAAVLLASAFS